MQIKKSKKQKTNEMKSLNKVRGREETIFQIVMRKSFSEEMTFKLIFNNLKA